MWPAGAQVLERVQGPKSPELETPLRNLVRSAQHGRMTRIHFLARHASFLSNSRLCACLSALLLSQALHYLSESMVYEAEPVLRRLANLQVPLNTQSKTTPLRMLTSLSVWHVAVSWCYRRSGTRRRWGRCPRAPSFPPSTCSLTHCCSRY